MRSVGGLCLGWGSRRRRKYHHKTCPENRHQPARQAVEYQCADAQSDEQYRCVDGAVAKGLQLKRQKVRARLAHGVRVDGQHERQVERIRAEEMRRDDAVGRPALVEDEGDEQEHGNDEGHDDAHSTPAGSVGGCECVGEEEDSGNAQPDSEGVETVHDSVEERGTGVAVLLWFLLPGFLTVVW